MALTAEDRAFRRIKARQTWAPDPAAVESGRRSARALLGHGTERIADAARTAARVAALAEADTERRLLARALHTERMALLADVNASAVLLADDRAAHQTRRPTERPIAECDPWSDMAALLGSLAATARRIGSPSDPWRPAVVSGLLALFGHSDSIPRPRWVMGTDEPAMPVFRADGTIGDGVYRLERVERPVRVPAQPVRYFASAPTVWVKGERPSVERARTALADVVTLVEPQWLTAITACTERRYCGACEAPLKRERGRWVWRCECHGVDTGRPAVVTGWDITGGLVPRRALRTLADTGAPADVATVLHRECRDCGAAFTIPRRRGRPAVRCEQCR